MNIYLTLHIIGRVGLAASVTALFAGGAFAGPRQEQALKEVRSIIGDAACSTDAQCRTVAIGSRVCGGPDAFLAWSIRKTDPKALQRAAERYNAAQAAEQPPGSRRSICTVLVDPGAVCRAAPRVSAGGMVAKSCTLRPKTSTPALPSR